jgi:peptide/nickel transport system substrate-binding protein
MKKSMVLVLLVFVGFLTLLPGMCLGQAKPGGSLVIASDSDIKQLDPHKGMTAAEGMTFTLICDNLVNSSKSFEAKPGLAESWEVSGDGKEWVFRLRKGVKFHNGRELTAQDIKFNMDRIMDPNTGAAMRSRYTMVDSVAVVDPHTVKFILKQPSGALLSAFFGSGVQTPIIAPESVDKEGKVTQPIGTGPFVFVEWKANDHCKFVKFKDYWQKGLPYLDEVVIKPVPDETVRLTSIRTGDVDIAFRLPVDEVARLMQKPPKEITFFTDVRDSTLFFHFNVSKPPFNDVRVRQAVAYGMNKEEITMAVYRGHGEVVNQPFPRKSAWYCDIPETPRDVVKAKALLKEAGYPNGFDVVLCTTTTIPALKVAAEVLQAQLKEIGIRVQLDVNDWPTLVKKSVAGEFAFGTAGWAPIADPVILYPGAFLPKGAYSFLTGKAYENAQLTEAIEKASESVDFQKRKELYTKAVKIIVEEAPWIFVTGGPNPMAARSYVKGFQPHLNGLWVYADGGLQHTWLDK